VERLRDWRYPVAELSSMQALGLEPDLILDDARGAIAFFPDEGFVYPRVLLGHLLHRAVDAGVVCHFGSAVSAFDVSGSRVRAVRCRATTSSTPTPSFWRLAAGLNRSPGSPVHTCR
jgi:glycine/D-amino acid oxidase-like deaminating enzyme